MMTGIQPMLLMLVKGQGVKGQGITDSYCAKKIAAGNSKLQVIIAAE